jgi:hypothetical protein
MKSKVENLMSFKQQTQPDSWDIVFLDTVKVVLVLQLVDAIQYWQRLELPSQPNAFRIFIVHNLTKILKNIDHKLNIWAADWL